MKYFAAHISLILTGAVLVIGAFLLISSRLEYCGQTESMRPRTATRAAKDTVGPTLAPPPTMVVVNVETDKSDLEIGWADN